MCELAFEVFCDSLPRNVEKVGYHKSRYGWAGLASDPFVGVNPFRVVVKGDPRNRFTIAGAFHLLISYRVGYVLNRGAAA
jgi:hypothetical protein